MKKLLLIVCCCGAFWLFVDFCIFHEEHKHPKTKTSVYTNTYEERRKPAEDAKAEDAKAKREKYRTKYLQDHPNSSLNYNREDAGPDTKIVAAWIVACRKAAQYKIAWEDYRSKEDAKNYLKWKREARRLAILLGY